MLGKEEASSGIGEAGGTEGSHRKCQVPGGRRMYWRSASWSASRSMLPPLNPDSEKDSLEQSGMDTGQMQRPLTPRSQQNFKARSCLPPLQPLSIARRSLDEWPRAGSDDIGEWPIPHTPSGRDLTCGGERLKLDLSNIQKNPENRNGGLVRREKIAFFDKECSKVAEHIYLGGDAVAKDKDILKQNGITHILNCVGFVCPEYFKSDFVYRTLWLQDSPSEDITSILYDVFDYFEDVRDLGGRVFVHCCQGVSRSTSLVIAYLMWREGQSFEDAFQYVKAARGIADPNMGFACQLLQCQKRVHAFPLSPSSLLRMYRIAPHSPYDPLHLVPKMLNDPSPSALDSRGAFIIHIPSAIYLWIGKKCEPMMERDARGAVCQIVRYEKIQGPLILVREGEEPSYFWDAFSNLLPLMDKTSKQPEVSIKILPGDRKEESYDVDYDIFLKATVGGFVPPFASSEAEHETHLPARESCWSGLRRKFVSGNMKDFVYATKSGLSRVYPDSVYIHVDQSAAKQLHSSTSLSSSSSSPSPSPSSACSSLSSSSSSSSTSSPPYLSPDSISSDSSINSTCFSDSPSASPSTSACTTDLSTLTLSELSNMQVLPTKISPHSISKSSKYIDVNFASRPSSQSATVPKRFPLSIAERRGSLTRSLTLPMPTDDSRMKDAQSSCLATLRERSNSLNDSLYPEDMLEPQQVNNGNQETGLHKSLGNNFGLGTGAADVVYESLKTRQSCPTEGKEAHFTNGSVLGDSGSGELLPSFVCRWPSLANVEVFKMENLESSSAFIFVPSSSGKVEDKTLYFWIGRLSNSGIDRLQGSIKTLDDLRENDWREATHDALSKMGLPMSTKVEIYKENEEPPEFLSFLNSLCP